MSKGKLFLVFLISSFITRMIDGLFASSGILLGALPIVGLEIACFWIVRAVFKHFDDRYVPSTTGEDSKAASENKVIFEKKGNFYEITLPKSRFMFECPDCGKTLPRDVNECTNCGVRFKKNA